MKAATITYRTMSCGKKTVDRVDSNLCGARKFKKTSLTKYTSTTRTKATFNNIACVSERFHHRTQYETNTAAASGIARNMASWNAEPVIVNPFCASHIFPNVSMK